MAQKEPEKSADKLELDALLDGVNLDRCCFVCNHVILESVPYADALNDFETAQPDTSGRPPSR